MDEHASDSHSDPELPLDAKQMAEFLAREATQPFETHTCPYLPAHEASAEGFLVPQIPGSLYRELLDLGFRRSGRVLYRPDCETCQQCVQLRVPVEEFRASRSQRRVLRRNQDIRVRVEPLSLTEEKRDLLDRYLAYQHPEDLLASSTENATENSTENYVEMLFRRVTPSCEVQYYDAADKLIAVSALDLPTGAASSVYHYFDPDEARRSLGVFSALWEIDWCKAERRSYYYLGFWIRDCRRMNYKNLYRPYELLDAEGNWHRFDQLDPEFPPQKP